jgi:hypothetical protein
LTVILAAHPIHRSTAAMSLMSTPSRCMACIVDVAGPQFAGFRTASADRTSEQYLDDLVKTL